MKGRVAFPSFALNEWCLFFVGGGVRMGAGVKFGPLSPHPVLGYTSKTWSNWNRETRLKQAEVYGGGGVGAGEEKGKSNRRGRRTREVRKPASISL